MLNPSFNDLVVHEGFVYGFIGPSLACLDLATGDRVWRGNRYGGQILLLKEQDLLVILTEKGKLALVEASSDGFTELAHIPAIEGKTWNHPAVARDILLVRNTSEMKAFRLPAGEKL